MPFTPFHLGPSFWIGLFLFRFINLFAFLIASVIVDIEPFFVLLLNLDYPLHGFLHTFLGGTIVAITLSGIIYRFRIMMREIAAVLKLPQESDFKIILFSCILGVYFHIFLDSFLYADMKSFFPFKINSLYGLVSFNLMYLFCSFCFILGGLLYLVKLSKGRLKSILKAVSLLTSVGFIISMLILCWLSWSHSPFDDGPFTGINYPKDISAKPDSRIIFYKKFTFEVYNRIDDKAPVIALRDNEGKLIWAKVAIVSNIKNYETYKVDRLELVRGRKILTGYHAQGIAYWTFGREAANFYFDKRGDLEKFYLSW